MTRNPVALVAFVMSALTFVTVVGAATCPRNLAQLNFGPSDAVAAGVSLAAVSAGEVVVIVDLQDEQHPARVGELRLQEDVMGLEWVGTTVVASTWSWLSVIEVGGDGDARLVHQIPMIQGRRHLATAGSILWAVDWNWSGGTMPTALTAFDLSVPAEPGILGVFSFAADAADLAVAGELAFVADQSAGLRILDISDPGAVAELASVLIDGAWRVDASSDLAVVASEWDGLTVVDVHLPSSPRVLGTVDAGRDAIPYDVRLRDERLYVGFVACDPHICPADGGLSVFDLSDPAVPHAVGGVDFDSGATAMTWFGDRLLVADHEAGLRVISVDDEQAPSEVARLNPGLDEAFAVDVVGDLALVGDRGLRVVELGDGSEPQLVASLELDEAAEDLAFDHSLAGQSVVAYLGGRGTLSLIDVSNPRDPELLVELQHQQASRAAMAGGELAVADGEAGLWVLDLINPTEPVDRGHYSLPGEATAVAMAGGEIVVAYRVSGSGSAGIVRFVGDDHGGWWQASTLAADQRVIDLALDGDLLLAVVGSGFSVVDMSDRTGYEMTELARIDGVYGQRLAVSGSLAYVSSWPGALVTVDLREPGDPLLTGRAVWQFPIADGGPQGGWDVASYSGLAVVADGEFGLRVMDAAGCRCGRRDPADRPIAVE